MSGIVGIFNLSGDHLPEFDGRAALRSIRHRGPDDDGMFQEGGVFLGATSLAVADGQRGAQPVADETGRYHLVMDGRIFDDGPIGADLEARGHRLRSRCDAELALHLIEESWSAAMDRLDGQFALAACDALERRLLLARDRMGICPLFYAETAGCLVFASEMKALFATGLIRPEIDPRSLDAVLAFGCVPAPRAVFRGVRSLPPGRFLEVQGGVISERTYWDLSYPDAGEYPQKPLPQWSREFHAVLRDACRKRLEADVPVGLYLSGGIDSATVAAMVAGAGDIRRRVFSIRFPEPGLDESRRMAVIARFLRLQPHVLTYRQSDLAEDLPKLIYHAETPLVTTESVPLMALSRLASRQVKAVLTGEGADEAMGGYRYFRWEAMKQRMGGGLGGQAMTFLARRIFRGILGERNPFYPLPQDAAWAQELFGFYPAIMINFFYLRLLRQMVYSREMLERQHRLSDAELLDLPRESMRRWDVINRTLYIASRVFLTNHLLAAHGDRALTACSVEGRYPFLDRRVQEFLAAVPPGLKAGWWWGKYLLRRAMAGRLPGEVLRRTKKPFLAPFGTPFVGEGVTEYVQHLLSPAMLSRFGYFDVPKVRRIVDSLVAAKQSMARDRKGYMRLDRSAVRRTMLGMAVTFVVSTQLLADLVSTGEFPHRE